MVARKFIISHNDSIFDVDYDTDDGLEVLKIQLISLTSIPPHLQQITGEDDDRVVSDDSNLTGISNKLKLIKINEEEKEVKVQESIAAVVVQQNEEESIRDVPILGGDDVSDDSDVVHVSNELKELTVADLMKSDEELAQMLQAEEEALMLQEFALINALSLKSEIDTDGKVDICLAGDPVTTSLGLPVVLDALDDLINVLNTFDNISKVSLSWPLIKLNRIHSGSVLASGEELPFGIATSAFDGLRTSKWEEPDGARGCWIVYKLSDNQMHKLVAYDIMSANDAPERDPMDWVVEGSHDGGSSWRILDKQTSQMFKDRFQRKSYKINSDSVPCNTFRKFPWILDTGVPSKQAMLAWHKEALVDQHTIILELSMG
ncbi:PREDICTED: peptide-N(4)-(N-acetyl-beta-glucosaminyl)asparagine amidase-like [Populus euphratica]|uniref:Peptide-N(4)-(N-acetyl-beta- glucosaminyl)asparagine amidase-like n=1 Tax=Populus euphratica TaxID=75702 RepID=A0AAJ6T6Y8_POPEU|nr:PREDICTED: peptide-N(4)-(N-acetyl-beta-glucosaminyl)asparagine amidase-like [Populus euphratica]